MLPAAKACAGRWGVGAPSATKGASAKSLLSEIMHVKDTENTEKVIGRLSEEEAGWKGWVRKMISESFF